MKRALRIVTVGLFTFVAVLVVGLALALSRLMAAFPMSLNGGDPAAARLALWAFAAGYVTLAVLTAAVLLPDQLGPVARRLRRIVLLADVVVHVFLVAVSLPLAGWPPFLYSIALLTLLTMALLADAEPARETAGAERAIPSTGR